MAEPYLHNLTILIDRLAPLASEGVRLQCKHFFSGAALYANDKICASLTPAGLALKLPEPTRLSLMAKGAGTPLRYFEQAPVKGEYVVLSSVVIENPAKLKTLFSESIAFVCK